MKRKNGFRCSHCKQLVPITKFMGIEHRNHCPFCLWSKHVDLNKPGDRKAKCGAGMEPVGLTFKQEGMDKYGRPKQGEIMIIHRCAECGKISINRIAGDDEPKAILNVLKNSKKFSQDGIKFLTGKDKKEILTQLFGKKEKPGHQFLCI